MAYTTTIPVRDCAGQAGYCDLPAPGEAFCTPCRTTCLDCGMVAGAHMATCTRPTPYN